MTTITAQPLVTFREKSAGEAPQSVPFSHLSLEVGHLYMEDFALGRKHLDAYFKRVARWVDAARDIGADRHGKSRPRISTCFLIDDYFSQLGTPADLIEMVLAAAGENGLTIDYLARESACAKAGDIDLARLVRDQLVAEPIPGANGSRPPLMDTGWLSNGQNSSVLESPLAMSANRWRPALQNAVNRHSIFVDVELWDDENIWSCAYLAAVWQLLRLGVLRNKDRQVVEPVRMPASLPRDWTELPAVMQVNERATPFTAYRTFSILGSRFVETEVATRVVLGQVPIAEKVMNQVLTRSRAEGIDLPKDILERTEYLFISD
ncbi:SCO2522 family protein [Actinoplanes utahensis]|uniref:Uncharacterized protein n=1 Tax=Actinoplanes utahensis TaxID=1869 RepID=A0A0A6UAM5_ACTUT|nr:SCO2522 family protein [Actinoplanes utahensis]KHD73095.1 hypothetical protein MB27_36260 [Actinoplanes utahensis]GIF34286.1 hypothetical protein Aut01nite_72720 [Actinoplanes utahensis]